MSVSFQPWTRVPRLLTVLEVSKVLRISTALTYDLVQSGAIPAKRIGRNGRRGRWLVEAEAVTTYWEGIGHD